MSQLEDLVVTFGDDTRLLAFGATTLETLRTLVKATFALQNFILKYKFKELLITIGTDDDVKKWLSVFSGKTKELIVFQGQAHPPRPVFTATPAERISARLHEVEGKPIILDKRTAFNLNYLFKDVDFSQLPKRQLRQFIESARTHLMTSTCKSVAKNLHYALDGHITSGIYYAFRDSTPYVIKITSVSTDADVEFNWSQQIDSPYIIKYLEVITLKTGLPALVMKAYTRSAEDMLNAWQTKGSAYTAREEETAKEEETKAAKKDEEYTGDEAIVTISHQAIANLFLTVVYAIRHLNALQICHGDIKPGNILIDSTGKMVLADLGAMVQYGQSLHEMTGEFSMVDVEYPVAEYGQRGCLQMDMVCLASTLMAFVTHKRATRLVALQSRVHAWKEKGNFIASLAEVCLQCNITSTNVDLDRMIAAGEALIRDKGLNLLV